MLYPSCPAHALCRRDGELRAHQARAGRPRVKLDGDALAHQKEVRSELVRQRDKMRQTLEEVTTPPV